jgi:hypothetical protein
MDGKPRTCVIISYWTAQPAKNLHRLLAEMQKIDAGAPYDLLIVCNGGLELPLILPARFNSLKPRIINRENTGYNLGAWECGWRNAGEYEYFLFLQDDCRLNRRNWVNDFELCMSRDEGIGLLGEAIMWDQAPWQQIREDTDRDLGPAAWPEGEPVHPIDAYLALLDQHGIPRGKCGSHLQSLILFTSRSILEQINGFPIMGSDYRAAVACEIGFSRLIESRGYRLSRIGSRSFELIGHRQWNEENKLKVHLRWRLSILWKRLLRGDGFKRELRRFINEWRNGQMPGTDYRI